MVLNHINLIFQICIFVAYFGVHYESTFMQTVQLVQSRPFSLTKSDDQAAFYVLLCKLLWYLSSGRSHVGLKEYDEIKGLNAALGPMDERWREWMKAAEICSKLPQAPPMDEDSEDVNEDI
jgi:hypothetical protein